MIVFGKHYQDAIRGIASPDWLQIRCDLVRNSPDIPNRQANADFRVSHGTTR